LCIFFVLVVSQRVQCEIVPEIYLGSEEQAANNKLLHRCGITHIVLFVVIVLRASVFAPVRANCSEIDRRAVERGIRGALPSPERVQVPSRQDSRRRTSPDSRYNHTKKNKYRRRI
jgi:hypothetical protein